MSAKTSFNSLAATTTFTILSIVFLTEPMFASIHNYKFASLEPFFITPLFYLLTAFLISLLTIRMFAFSCFGLWNKTILSWYGPIGILVVATGAPGASFAYPSRSDLALYIGAGLVVTTLIFVSLQHYREKKS